MDSASWAEEAVTQQTASCGCCMVDKLQNLKTVRIFDSINVIRIKTHEIHIVCKEDYWDETIYENEMLAKMRTHFYLAASQTITITQMSIGSFQNDTLSRVH